MEGKQSGSHPPTSLPCRHRSLPLVCRLCAAAGISSCTPRRCWPASLCACSTHPESSGLRACVRCATGWCATRLGACGSCGCACSRPLPVISRSTRSLRRSWPARWQPAAPAGGLQDLHLELPIIPCHLGAWVPASFQGLRRLHIVSDTVVVACSPLHSLTDLEVLHLDGPETHVEEHGRSAAIHHPPRARLR